jgi:hypothetical protein
VCHALAFSGGLVCGEDALQIVGGVDGYDVFPAVWMRDSSGVVLFEEAPHRALVVVESLCDVGE